MFLKLFGDGYSFTGTDGKDYHLVNLTLRDLAKYVAWVQYKPYKDALAADLPRHVCKAIYEECKLGKVKEEIKEGEFREFNISWTSTVVQRSLFTLEGFIRLLEISFEKSYNDVSLEDILGQEGLESLQAGFYKGNALIADNEDEDEENLEKN